MKFMLLFSFISRRFYSIFVDMKINASKMVTPIEETLEQNLKVKLFISEVSQTPSVIISFYFFFGFLYKRFELA